VIKIESPKRNGDSGRRVPPLAVDGDSPFFQQTNVGSESVCLDVTTPTGRRAFEHLVARADALLSNFRPRAIENLGLTYAALASINPRLVVCTLTGYGLDGPLANAPGYDYLFQARYGNMSLTGGPDTPPTRSGSMYVDLLGAALAAFSVSGALHMARQTGRGGEVDTSLMEAAVWALGYYPAWLSAANFIPERLRWGSHQSVVPSRMFATADGFLMIMCQTEEFWRKLCDRIGRPELLERAEFATLVERKRNRSTLEPILEQVFAGRTTEEWLEQLGNDVPAAPVNSLVDAMSDPQLIHSGLLRAIEHPVFRDLKLIMPPFKIDGERTKLNRAPRLGEHTRSVLQELCAFSPAEVDAIVSSGSAFESRTPAL
jgi:crotonobetainyl-CoA:carnitine CoA-transferase CaiB-like acyl-CoA transferase